jgi:hypothetical protein
VGIRTSIQKFSTVLSITCAPQNCLWVSCADISAHNAF